MLTFKLDKNQSHKLRLWLESKEEKHAGAIGGRYTYTMTPTSMGTIMKVIDNIDKNEIDLTDYESW